MIHCATYENAINQLSYLHGKQGFGHAFVVQNLIHGEEVGDNILRNINRVENISHSNTISSCMDKLCSVAIAVDRKTRKGFILIFRHSEWIKDIQSSGKGVF